jgi:hypothetical protein
MTMRAQEGGAPWWRILAQKDVLAGLFLMGVAALGLWLSRDYQIGTALRMGTGYVPRLLCWVLLGLGLIVLLQGLPLPSSGGGRSCSCRCRSSSSSIRSSRSARSSPRCF